MPLTNSNTYIEPTASTSLGTARIYQNDNFRSLLTNFYSETSPTSVNLTADSVPLAVPDGMLFRHKDNGALYIADSVNKQGSPIGGNFTRVGIGNRVEATTSTLTTNASTYEVGELVATLDSGNETIYLCTGTGSGFPSDFVDISSPASYVVDGVSGNVTIQAPTLIAADFVAENSANVQGSIYADDYIIHNGDPNTYFGFPSADNYIVRTAGSNKLSISSTETTVSTDLLVDGYIKHSADPDTYLLFTTDSLAISVGGTTAISVSDSTNLAINQDIDVSGHINMLDAKELTLGTDDDIELHFDGSNFNIDVNNGGNIYFRDGNSADANSFIFDIDNGDLTASGEITAYSDVRLKSNIIQIDNALAKVANLRGVYFDKDNKRGLGVIAQEVEQVLPEVVTQGEYKSVAYGNIVGVLIEAIKELKAEVEELKNKNCT